MLMVTGSKRTICSTHNEKQCLVEALRMAADGRIKPMIDLFEKNNVQQAVDKTANGEVGLRAVAKDDEERKEQEGLPLKS
jgi:D-arabinose 1-dehydrogenase-like Zn-dependent alcohol dehydrogenase